MKIKIDELQKIVKAFLMNKWLNQLDACSISNNILDAEISWKKSHWLNLLEYYIRNIDEGNVNIGTSELKIIKNEKWILYTDAENKIWAQTIESSLDIWVKMLETNWIVSIGVKDIWHSWYIWSYSRKIVEKNLIFIWFNNAREVVTPQWAVFNFFWTNPLTIWIPSFHGPILLDMATSKITMGAVMEAKNNSKNIKKWSVIDSNWKYMIKPEDILSQGLLLPISEHKWSWLSFVIEILAWIMTQSFNSIYENDRWYGWFYVLLNPSSFIQIKQFKTQVSTFIDKLKWLPREKGVNEIFFAWEQSMKLRNLNLRNGYINVDQQIIDHIKNII